VPDLEQQMYLIGYLFLGAQPSDPQKQERWPTLRELGYGEGSNLVFERRFAAGEGNGLPRSRLNWLPGSRT
jgi:hypothetical protein